MVKIGEDLRFTRHEGNVPIILRACDVLVAQNERHDILAMLTKALMPHTYVS
jgi:hypothetical protein